jgi:tRNA-specific 2-thiouridylase
MSGGVDSSVAAAMLLREGFEVVGCFMRLGTPGEMLDELVADTCAGAQAAPGAPAAAPVPLKPLKIGHQGCCSINDAADARAVAAELGIPFYVANFKRDFGRIIDYFVDEYAAGRTPNPCVRCNDWLKFGKLREYARQIGAQYVASGHYARVEPGPGGARLLRGLDRGKDQSYVLFGVPRDHLPRMLLPVGGLEKPRVRELARQWGLPVFDKPDSQEICFVPDNDYAGLLERRRPALAAPGAVLDDAGRVVGEHGGQHRFTIGQRRGVGLALGHPIYVVGKDPSANTVTVGPREMLLSAGCQASEANWLVEEPAPGRWRAVLARYRSNSQPVPARVRRAEEVDEQTPSGRRGRFEVRFDEPQQAVAPGQAIVLYDASEPDVVLGGGWIRIAVGPSTNSSSGPPESPAPPPAPAHRRRS